MCLQKTCTVQRSSVFWRTNYRSNMASFAVIANFEFRTGLPCYRRLPAKDSGAASYDGSVLGRSRSSRSAGGSGLSGGATMDIFADQGRVRAIYHVSVGVSDIERAR